MNSGQLRTTASSTIFNFHTIHHSRHVLVAALCLYDNRSDLSLFFCACKHPMSARLVCSITNGRQNRTCIYRRPRRGLILFAIDYTSFPKLSLSSRNGDESGHWLRCIASCRPRSCRCLRPLIPLRPRVSQANTPRLPYICSAAQAQSDSNLAGAASTLDLAIPQRLLHLAAARCDDDCPILCPITTRPAIERHLDGVPTFFTHLTYTHSPQPSHTQCRPKKLSPNLQPLPLRRRASLRPPEEPYSTCGPTHRNQSPNPLLGPMQ